MAGLLVSLPIHVACQIMCAGNSTNGNVTLERHTSTGKQTSSSLPEGYIAFRDIGFAYKSYHTELVLWQEAQLRCSSDGAMLALVDSLKKLEYAMKVKPCASASHIGIRRRSKRSEWKGLRIGPPLVSSLPWAPYEPTYGADENCAFMWMDGRGLAAGNCYKNIQHFICEIPI